MGEAEPIGFEASGLGSEWDGLDVVRDRLRAGKPLVVQPKTKGKDATIPECTSNSDVLLPALQRLFVSQLKLPDIESLREEVNIVYSKNQRQAKEDEIDDAAWDLRKMLRFIKRKANRDNPSQDTRADFSNVF